MESAAVEVGRGRWSTAFALLSVAVLLLPVFNALALILLPLGLLVLALPANRAVRWIAIGLALAAVGTVFLMGPLAAVNRGWALMIGSIYLSLALAQPEWDTTARSLSTVLIAVIVAAIGLLVSDQLGALDGLIQGEIRAASAAAVENLPAQVSNGALLTEVAATTEWLSEVQAEIYPALLALKSLAALALVAWWVRRIGRSDAEAFRLGRLQDFRFNDNLIWLLILGLLVALSPAGPLWSRAATNLLVFMGSLYALRGLGIFVYLAEGMRSVLAVVVSALLLIFLFPVVVTGALLMGIGDTWVDVRNRPMVGG